MLHAGYMADCGCTWVCGGDPGAADRALRARWHTITEAVLDACRPGATAAELHRVALAANGPGRPAPWPRPLYLAHGLGLGGVEPPFVGTDLGLDAEARTVLEPGMVAPQAESTGPGPLLRFGIASRARYGEWTEALAAESGIDVEYRTDGIVYVALTASDARVLAARARWQRAAGLRVERLRDAR